MIHERLGWLNLDEDFLEYLDEEGYVEVTKEQIYVEYEYWARKHTGFLSRFFEPRSDN